MSKPKYLDVDDEEVVRRLQGRIREMRDLLREIRDMLRSLGE